MTGYNKNEVIGKMRDRIILQNVNRSRSLTGFASESWVDIATIWAFAESKLPGSNETIIEGKNTAKNICDFTIRYISAITEESRVVFKNKIYQVKNIKISHDRRFISFQGVYYDSYSTVIGLQFCSASLLAQSSLSAALMRVIKYQASLNAFGSVSADISFVQKLASSLNANASLISNLQLAKNVESSIAASSLLNSDLKIAKNIESSLNANGTLVSDLKIAKNADANLSALASLSGDISFVQKVASSLNASSLLSGDISFVKNAEANLSSLASLTGNINFVQKTEASLLTSASVTGNLTIPKTFNASLLATGTTTADLTVNAPSASLLLDLYPSAAAAYSLRKLRTAYTGSAIRVRASTSGAEGDVSFDVNNTISASSTVTVTAVGTSGLSIGQQVTFSTFWNAGGSNQNVFLTRWYDQSGNARDAAQTTQANQPQIVSSGFVINLNSKPTVQFNNQQFITRASFNVSSVSTFTLLKKYNIEGYGAYLRNVTLTGNSFAIISGLSGSWTSQCVNFTNGVDVNPNPTRRFTSKTLPTNQYLENWIYNTSVRNIYENNIILTTINGLSGWSGKLDFTLGSISYNGNPANDKVEIQELIIYDLNQTANLSAINTNINTHYAIY